MTLWLKNLWIYLKGILNLQSATDLLYLAIQRLVTPDVQDLITALIKEAAQKDITSTEKKQYVMSRLADLQRQMRSNVATLRNETLSAAINLLVEYLQTSGQLKRTSSTTEASSNEK
jgi:hypothetical protein